MKKTNDKGIQKWLEGKGVDWRFIEMERDKQTTVIPSAAALAFYNYDQLTAALQKAGKL